MAYLHRQVHLGKDPLSVEARVKILEERKFADNVYKVNQKKKLLLFSSKRSPFSCVVIQLCLNVKGSLSCTNHICGWFLLAYGKLLVIATVALMSTIRSGLCFQISFISVWVFFFMNDLCALNPVLVSPLSVYFLWRSLNSCERCIVLCGHCASRQTFARAVVDTHQHFLPCVLFSFCLCSSFTHFMFYEKPFVASLSNKLLVRTLAGCGILGCSQSLL